MVTVTLQTLRCDQRSDEWREARLGRLTGSRVAKAFAFVGKDKRDEGAGRKGLRTELVLERLTRHSHESDFVSAAMKQGIEREPAARALYEARTGTILDTPGCLIATDLMVGYSPDGLVGEDGMVEAKSPLAHTHLEYLRSGVVPYDYRLQVRHGLWLTGRQWCDWFSYQPEFPGSLAIKVVRMHRDEQEIAEHHAAVVRFLMTVDAEFEAVRTLGDLKGVLKEST